MSSPELSGGGAQRIARTLGRADPRHSAPSGVWGMALFLCAEVALFGTIIGSYFYLESVDRSWPPHGVEKPEVLLPVLATAYLLLTLLPIHLAARASRRGRRGRTVAAIAVGLAAQCGYLAWQILLFSSDLHKFSPRQSAYGSVYFTMLAVHHAHVLLGLALDLALISQLLAKGLTRYWLIAVRNLALYWYVVGALAVCVLFTQISPSL
ncbi:MAG TPA: cytochrome c oxidase subunit 3 [Solirubrobacteraceae bacterium]|nr:cytochrome c oxidase subunit 3 [Solirubrobacteraceae bacterium]